MKSLVKPRYCLSASSATLGVELYELVYNNVTKRLIFDLVTEAFNMRGETHTRKIIKPVAVGQPQEDVFIELE
jgi:hypothetical protein